MERWIGPSLWSYQCPKRSSRCQRYCLCDPAFDVLQRNKANAAIQLALGLMITMVTMTLINNVQWTQFCIIQIFCFCLNKSLEFGQLILEPTFIYSPQRAKKVVSDSPGLVHFAIGLVNSVLNLPDGQVKIFWRIKITKVL